MSRECGCFYEDEVVCFNKKGKHKLGMVLQNAEFASSDEDSDDDEKLLPGQIRVSWLPSSNEEVIHEKKVSLFIFIMSFD